MVILQQSDSDEYRSLAESLATKRGERIVRSIEQIQNEESVLYVDPPTEISEQILFMLNSRENKIKVGGVSVITGRTPTAARELANRNETTDGKHSLIVRMTNKSMSCSDSDAILLQGDDLQAERVRDVCTSDLSSLSMLTNADDIHAYLNDGYVCGFPTSPEEFEFEGVQPHCVAGGKRECPLDGELLPAENVAAPFVFLNACSSPLANNDSGLPVNLGLALLSQATNLIAPYRLIVVHRYQVALHYALLRAGYTAAERVSLLNQSTTQANIESHPYVAFGLPEAALETSSAQSFDIEYTPNSTGYRIVATNVDAHVLDFTVPADVFADQQTYFLRTTANDDGTELFYTAFREGSRIRIVICSWGRLQTDRIAFDLAESSVLDDSPYVPDLDEATTRVDVGLISGKARGQLKNARNTIAGAADYREREPFLPTVHETITQRLQQAESSLQNAQKSLLETLRTRRTNLLYHEYDGKTYLDNVDRQANGCPYCDRDVFVKTLTDTYRRIDRTVGICPKCSYIFDAPGRGDIEYPTLEGDFTPITYGETGEVELSFVNPRDRTVKVIATVTPSVYSEEVFTPTEESVEIEPQSSMSIPFHIDMSDMEDNRGNCWLEGHVVTDDLQIYTGMRTMYIYGQ